MKILSTAAAATAGATKDRWKENMLMFKSNGACYEPWTVGTCIYRIQTNSNKCIVHRFVGVGAAWGFYYGTLEWGTRGGVAACDGIHNVLWEVFTVVDGGKINAVALGIAGDRSVNLLFLIKDGGIGDLKPQVFWQLIGTNDLGC
jgi:hypothetical protein